MKNPTFSKLLNNPNFVKLWVSQMLSQFSIQIMSFYILTRIFTLTQSTIAVSLMWIAGSLPALLIGPFSGAVVDSFSRRKLMIAANLLQAVVVASLLFADKRVFTLYTVVFLYWLLDQFYYPSQQATAPGLVDKGLLPAANGLFLLTQQASILVGFGLGGVLLSTLGRTPTIIIAAVNLALASLAASRLPKDEPKRFLLEKDLTSFWNDIKVGFRFISHHREVLFPLGIIICAQVFMAVITTTIPTYAHEVLHRSLNEASIYLIIPGMVGALVTTVNFPKLLSRFRKKYIVEMGLLIGAVSLLALGFNKFLPLGKTVISVLVALGMGASFVAVTLPAQSMLQQRTPKWLLGRVFGQLGFLLILATTIPLIVSATIADELGIATLMGLMGAILLAGYFFIRHKADDLLMQT